MNRSAEHRLGSLDANVYQLAGTVPCDPVARFMVPIPGNGPWRLSLEAQADLLLQLGLIDAAIRLFPDEIPGQAGAGPVLWTTCEQVVLAIRGPEPQNLDT